MLVKKSNPSVYKRTVKKVSNSFNKLKMIRVSFENDSMLVHLYGGRVLTIPLSKYPEIKRLTKQQREHYHIAGGISLDFDDSDEVYHIEELIGLR